MRIPVGTLAGVWAGAWAGAWAYNQPGPLENMLFKRYRLINKSQTVSFDSMYVSQWADIDIGTASDDYSGCDSSLNLGYTFNAGESDGVYGETPPPAVAFDLFQ